MENSAIKDRTNTKIVAVTGHRPNKLNNEYDGVGPLSDAIRKEFKKIIEEVRPIVAISGMALGVDLLWAETCLDYGLPMAAAIPFKGQESIWPEKSKQRYYDILAKVTRIYYICEPGYAAWKMQKRNEFMVDRANMLIAVWDGTKGGTANCVQYAQLKGIEIIRINPKNII